MAEEDLAPLEDDGNPPMADESPEAEDEVGFPTSSVRLLVRVLPDPENALSALLAEFGLTIIEVADDRALWLTMDGLLQCRLRKTGSA